MSDRPYLASNAACVRYQSGSDLAQGEETLWSARPLWRVHVPARVARTARCSVRVLGSRNYPAARQVSNTAVGIQDRSTVR